MAKLVLLSLLALLFTPIAHASSVNVNVNSNTSTNQTSTNKIENNTHIRINSNGEVKEYNGSDGNIEVKSGDGKTSVSVKNGDSGINNTTSSAKVNAKTNIFVDSNTKAASPSSSVMPEATVAGVFKNNMNLGFWENLRRRLSAIFQGIF